MNDVVRVLEFFLQLQDSVVSGVVAESGGNNYEDSDDMFSISQSSEHVSYYSIGYIEHDKRWRSELVFSEINDPKGR